jgi:nucleoside 2-deoxyribosyltransferase
MDVYVATKAENYKVARLFMRALEEVGHDIAHDWTNQVATVGPAPDNIDLRRRLAREDLAGVAACDCFILIIHKDMVGSLIEYGAALALNKRIFIVVDYENSPVNSIFFDFVGITYMHPSLWAVENAVKWVDEVQLSMEDDEDDVEIEDPGEPEDVPADERRALLLARQQERAKRNIDTWSSDE